MKKAQLRSNGNENIKETLLSGIYCIRKNIKNINVLIFTRNTLYLS